MEKGHEVRATEQTKRLIQQDKDVPLGNPGLAHLDRSHRTLTPTLTPTPTPTLTITLTLTLTLTLTAFQASHATLLEGVAALARRVQADAPP